MTGRTPPFPAAVPPRRAGRFHFPPVVATNFRAAMSMDASWLQPTLCTKILSTPKRSGNIPCSVAAACAITAGWWRQPGAAMLPKGMAVAAACHGQQRGRVAQNLGVDQVEQVLEQPRTAVLVDRPAQDQRASLSSARSARARVLEGAEGCPKKRRCGRPRASPVNDFSGRVLGESCLLGDSKGPGGSGTCSPGRRHQTEDWFRRPRRPAAAARPVRRRGRPGG